MSIASNESARAAGVADVASDPNGADSAYFPKTPEVAAALAKAESCLNAGQPDKALRAVNHAQLKSPWITNAIAVCQIRLGNPQTAVEILRNLVVERDIHLRSDIPALFKVNFAVALLASDNFDGFDSTLHEIGLDAHPAARAYHDAFQKWKASLSFWDRLKLKLSLQPSRSFTSDAPLGLLN